MSFLGKLLSCLSIVVILFSLCQGREFVVGKENSWKVPSNPNDSLNEWASMQRFRVGDHLIFKYDGKTDSVMQVTEKDYMSCDASVPLKAYSNGDTTVELDGTGPFYFISGNKDNCNKGEKLEVKVVNPHHHHHHSHGMAPAPAPSGTFHWTTNAPAPTPVSVPTGGAHSLSIGFLSVVLVFGEGTRSKDGKLGAFKKGAFSIAAKCGVPVVPITLIGTGKIMPVGMESRLYPGSVKVVIQKPIYGNNTEELCNEARNIIAEALIREG